MTAWMVIAIGSGTACILELVEVREQALYWIIAVLTGVALMIVL